jgi:cytidylate kinase
VAARWRLTEGGHSMIRIITVEREFGSGGGAIAEALAKRLGWSLWDQLLTDEIARRMDSDRRTVAEHEERTDPLHYRLLKAFLQGSFEGSQNIPRLKVVDADRVREVAHQVVLEAAEAGRCVIVGRGAAYYLGGRTDALHVFTYAPFEEKVRRLEALGKSELEAIELVANVDRDRADFIKRYFDLEWPARHRFHLMLNSSIGIPLLVETIVGMAAKLGEQRTDEGVAAAMGRSNAP